MRLVQEQLKCKNPFSASHPFYLLVETHGSNSAHDQEVLILFRMGEEIMLLNCVYFVWTQKLMSFIETVMNSSLVDDGVICESDQQTKDVWRLREGITEALARRGAVYKYDVSLPHAHMYDLVEEVNEKFQHAKTDACAVGFGHLGDGNFH
jgi:hypothetical protein